MGKKHFILVNNKIKSTLEKADQELYTISMIPFYCNILIIFGKVSHVSLLTGKIQLASYMSSCMLMQKMPYMSICESSIEWMINKLKRSEKIQKKVIEGQQNGT